MPRPCSPHPRPPGLALSPLSPAVCVRHHRRPRVVPRQATTLRDEGVHERHARIRVGHRLQCSAHVANAVGWKGQNAPVVDGAGSVADRSKAVADGNVEHVEKLTQSALALCRRAQPRELLAVDTQHVPERKA
eukprot:587260-Rhodomonas_salina.3